MSNTGNMNFFSLDFCGLYKPGNSKVHGCQLEETFDLIYEWVDGRTFSATIPWDPNNSKSNKSKCYCKDIFKNKDNGDFLLVLWKSDTDSAGTLWGAQEDNETGSGSVVKYTNQYKGKKVIWGRPCYYWVVPELNAIISIKFDHSVCDAQLFEDYVSACINNRVEHKNRKREFTDKGYVRISYEGDGGSRLMYRFNMSLMSLNTSSAKIKDLAASVTHLIRRETILVDSKDERAEWVKKFTDMVPFVSAKPKSKQRKIEVKAEAKPTPKEISEIIEKNAREDRSRNDWDNVGFASDNGRVTWVDRYRLRDFIIIPFDVNSVFKAEDLYQLISGNRDRYLAPIRRSNKEREEAENSAATG
ncbi:MAG: hypothetical protein ACX936_00780 [Marinobacter sp.]